LPDPFFDQEADFYDRRSKADDFQEREGKFLAVARRALAQSSSTEEPLCIDLGCGPGAITLRLAELGFRAIGVDSSPKMIELAEKARAGSDPTVRRNVTFHHSDLDGFLQTFEGAANYILSSSVFEYLTDPIRVLSGAAARLQSRGLLAISVPNPRSLYRMAEPLILSRYPADQRYTSHWRNSVRAPDLARAAVGCRLRVVEMSHFGPLGLRGKALFPRLSHLSLVGTMTLVVLEKDLDDEAP
jgi:SAM-dependent methyltransferase